MPSIIPGYEYDIFISYRHNDNRSGWVTEFVNALQEELAATIKEPISIYFDKNPHDGLLETHNVDKSLEGKLKCLIFIPIISQTYCDPKSFAWQFEFVAFNKISTEDQLGRDIKLSNGNVASRILPIKIHDLDSEDTSTIKHEIGGVLRAIEFIHRSAGVNRPLTSHDDQVREAGKVLYRDQVNKVANAVKEIFQAIKNRGESQSQREQFSTISNVKPDSRKWSSKKIGIAVVATLLFAAILYFMFLNKENAPSQRPLSIAILPFRNTSSNGAQQDYGIGLANEIRSKLSESKHFLFISSLQSTIAYINSSASPKQIGSELEVNYLLNGIYQLSGDRIKIDVELIDTQTGRSIWNLSFNRLFDDIFEIQANIASKVYSQFSLADNQTKELPTKNLEAYGHYLTAQKLFYNRQSIVIETTQEAVVQLNMAIQLDSSFLDAYLELAYYKALLAREYRGEDLREYNTEYNQNRNDIILLLKLIDKQFPDSWKKVNIRGLIAYILYEDYDEAMNLFSEVIEHDPENFRALVFLGAIYKRKLMQKEALKYQFKARLLDPARPALWNEIAQAYLSMGDYLSCEKSIEHRVQLGYLYEYEPDMRPQQTQFFLFSTGRKTIGTGYELPQRINDKFFQRDYLGIISAYDSVYAASGETTAEGFYWKSVAYYHLQASDSLKRYVTSALTHIDYKQNWRTPILYALIGDKKKAFGVLNDLGKYWEHSGQDTWGKASTLRQQVLLLSLMGDYKGATEVLLKLNVTYPSFGDYEIMRVNPFFDKIKKEYPPFVDALNNLKLPSRISIEEAMKL